MILAAAGSGEASTAVVVALIGSLGIVVAAIVTGVWTARTNRRIGKPNGNGNLIEMVTTVLEQQGEQGAALRRLADDHRATRGMVEATSLELRRHMEAP